MRLINADKLVVQLKGEIERCKPLYCRRTNGKSIAYGTVLGLKSAIAFIEALATIEPYGTWIPCSERLPKPEEEVFIQTDKGTCTTAIYEDGTIYTEDSNWIWYDCDFEYDEEKDDYIISEGWWEYRHFNQDDAYNNAIDNTVIAWMPLPEPWKGEKKDVN